MTRTEAVEVFRVNLPWRKPMKLASERIHVAQNVLVRITSSGGVAGWGEAASAPTMTGETQATIFACADTVIGPAITGEMLDTPEDLRRVQTLRRRCGSPHPSAQAGGVTTLHYPF